MDEQIRLAGVVKESIVDGPGIRYTIFTQGCPHKCEGCHNPQTHDLNAGKLVSIEKIVNSIHENPLLKGVTLSGGEPFLQAKNLAKLVAKLDDRLNVITYTGFEFEYLLKYANEKNGYMDLLKCTDILIDGKFDINLKSEFLEFRGSSNQRVIDVKKSLKRNEVVNYKF